MKKIIFYIFMFIFVLNSNIFSMFSAEEVIQEKDYLRSLEATPEGRNELARISNAISNEIPILVQSYQTKMQQLSDQFPSEMEEENYEAIFKAYMIQNQDVIGLNELSRKLMDDLKLILNKLMYLEGKLGFINNL